MHVHQSHVFRWDEPSGSPLPWKDSPQPGEKGKASSLMPAAGVAWAHRSAESAGDKAGKGPTGVWAPPSQVRATLRRPAAPGPRPGCAGQASSGRLPICFSGVN